MDRLRATHVREHLRRLVHRGDAVAVRDQLSRDPAGAAAELEDGRTARQDGRYDLALASPGQERVQLHRAPVGRRRHARATTSMRRCSCESGSPSRPYAAASEKPAARSQSRSSVNVNMRMKIE